MRSRRTLWRRMSRIAMCCLALGLATRAAAAADWYVDGINGSNANDGTTPSTAWRTVTHALAQLKVAGPATVHLAPATYAAAQGEVFPWVMRNEMQLVGDAGSAATVIDGAGSTSTLVEFASLNYAGGAGPQTQLRQLTLRDAEIGVRLVSDWAHVDPTLRDLSITGMSVAGITLDTPSLWAGFVHPALERVRVSNCAVGVAATSFNWIGVWATDCEFSHNAAEGVSVACFIDASIAFDRCRIEGNGSHGVRLDGAAVYYELWANFHDCLFAGNGGDGLRAAQSAHLAVQDIRRCTIVDNAEAGVRDGALTSTLIEASILWGNGNDLAFQPGYPPTVRYCDISDGDFASSNGNFSADPLFVDANSGDYRLQWGSPCIETGDPATPLGRLDLARIARPVDGDLDTVERPDVGCYEFAPLFLQGSGQIGTTIRLESWGASGSPTAIWWTRGAPASPTATPFGELDLKRWKMAPLFVTAAQPGPPSVWQRTIPNDPALIGRTFAFQALSRSSAAPLGQALTNVVVLQVLP